MIKKLLKRLIRIEKGQALPMVLILMAVGGFIIAPLLSYTSAGLKAGMTYERIADEFYAADAGIEDGLWQINYDHLDEIFQNPEYHRYDYDTVYTYPSSYDLEVNGEEVTVEIRNIWIPKDLNAPSYAEAEDLIGTGKLIIAGSIVADSESETLQQKVKIYYYKDPTDNDLLINTIGVWLPPGVEYDDDGVCSLETWLDDNNQVYSRNISPHKGGQAIVWTFVEPILFTDLEGVIEGDEPMMYDFTFDFKLNDSESERTPEAVSWITTSGVPEIAYTWDADVRVFHINSTAGGETGTEINAYAIKSDIRQLVSGRNGDYRAIGNTLMLDLYPDWGGPVRDTLLGESDATVTDIPDNAQIEAAFLYWSAWLEEETAPITLFYDNCNDIDDYWYPGSDWDDTGYGDRYYEAEHDEGGGRELEMKDPLALSIYSSETVTLSFDYRIEDDRLECDPPTNQDRLLYAFYNDEGWGEWEVVFCGDEWPDGAATYWQTFSVEIPEGYLTDDFKIKFRIDGFSGWHEECHIDDIRVTAEQEPTADTAVYFEINGDPYHLEDDEFGNPTVPVAGAGSINATEWQLLENRDPATGQMHGYSYCCRANIAPLLQEFTDYGNETYSVGGVYGDLNTQWSYAGWSLIIIFSSPETQRQQLYLFDFTTGDFRYIAPHTQGLDFLISGFLVPNPIPGEENAAKMTCFVGDGDDYYSGDFIAINAPDVEHGHQVPNSYKLWDGITLPSSPAYPWMSNNANSPNNVWNGQSPQLSASGVDIDTFYIPWGDPPEDGLIKPEDSSAKISLNFAGEYSFGAELIQFLYLIISFRSEAVIGGTITYLVDVEE